MADREGGGRRQMPDYSYAANHNLVLTTNRSELPRRDNEPSGEPVTLAGRITMKDMGSRAQRDTTQLDQFKEEHKSTAARRDKKKVAAEQTKLGADFTSILEATNDSEGPRYRPRTVETRATYELILSFTAGKLGDVPADIMRDATDLLLEVLRGDQRDSAKKKEAEEILNVPLSNEEFSSVLNLAKKLTDYDSVTEAPAAGDSVDDQIGVAVIFEDDDDDEDMEADVLEGENEADPFEVLEVADDRDVDGTQALGAGAAAADQADSETGPDILIPDDAEQVVLDDHRSRRQLAFNSHDVDALWLQRKVSAALGDVHVAQAKTARAFEILAESPSARETENALMDLFEYSHFDLVKLLTANARPIFHCTRLAKAASDKEREAIFAEIRQEGLDGLLADLGLASRGAGPTPMDVDGAPAKRGKKRGASAAADASAPAAAAAADLVAPKSTVDLESMAFAHGAHTMTNKKVALPKGSFKRSKKGYEEIHVPAPTAPPMGADEKLVPIADLPEWAQAAFPNTKSLNRVQSQLYRTAFEQDENMLICAPTGAGKTNSAMLTVLGLIKHYLDEKTGRINLDAFKIVYVAPMKALVQEMVGNFGNRLAPFGIKVGELTGDAQMNKQQLQDTQMIVTTPEKWDVITRKGTDRSYTALVRLIIIDEVHLLHDDRGPVIEAIVARTLRHIEATRDHVRLVGLSATLPNYHDVASFMRVKASGLYFFDSSYRPCPLQQQYIGITEKKALKRFQVMNQVTYEKVAEEMGKNQVLVFVHSRKDTAKTAKMLRDMAIEQGTIGSMIAKELSREVLKTEAETATDKDLKEVLPYGIAIHHAGMSRADRTLVEELFADGHVQVLCSTATLAWGVNLPAHTVIIKGTQVYNPEKGKWVELSPQDVLQMLGRAGRPQYDTFGEGIIVTTHTELQFYLSLLNTQLPIESQLVSRLADTLNGELVLGSIASRQEAVEWMSYTYLHVRMRRAPGIYGIPIGEVEADPSLLQRRTDMVHSALALLEKNFMVKYDRRTGKVASTELGRIAAHYYIAFPSMALYHQQLRPQSTLIDLFRVFALSSEFKYIPVREEEKMEVQKLSERVPIPLKENPDEPTAKINVLLQAHISQLQLDGFSLMADMVYVTQSAQRLFRALFEMAMRRGWAQLARVCLDACKMVERRQWSSMTPLRQFRNMPAEIIKRIERKDLSFERYLDLTPEELGEHVGATRFGRTIHRYVHQVPRIEVGTQVVPVSRSLIKIDLTLSPDFQWDDKVHGRAQGFWVWVSDVDDEQLLYHEYFVLRARYATDDHTLSFTVPLFEPLAPNYFISVVSDSWLHSETRMALSFRNLLLPAKFAPPTEVLDLQPLPVSTLGKHAALFPVDFFNSIQTQVFHSLYMTDENALVCAPPGSGKTYCAEWAVLRALYHADRQSHQRIVYMAPYESIAKIRFRQWSAKFEDHNVVLLTGQTTRDMQLLEHGDIIIATAEHWDAMSRRWRQRKNVYNVWLFVADELHLMTDPAVSVTVEIACSRMRFISGQREADGQPRIRMVGFGASIANAKDLADWIGCAPAHVYNFAPSTRPQPLPITIQAQSTNDPASLVLAMIKPTYTQLALLERGQQAMVFVADQESCATVAAELASWLAPEQSWLQVSADSQAFQKLVAGLADKDLRESLENYGVGWVDEFMTARELEIMHTLFNSGSIQVLLATRAAAWHLEQLQCCHVIVLGTSYYDGMSHMHIDYPVADVLHMLGRGTTRAHLMTTTTKKEYYKRYLNEPLVVESLLDQHSFLDHLNTEVVTKTVENKQEAVDYLTWTFMYRRMTLNPNYYGLTGVTEEDLSAFLSDLVEGAAGDLAKSKCIAVEGDMDDDLVPLNLGMIAAYYAVSTESVDMFALSITEGTKLRGLLDVLSHAVEFGDGVRVPIRKADYARLRTLYERACTCKLGEDADFNDPHVKTHILLQAHFARVALPRDLAADLRAILALAVPLLYAAVDVIASQGWLPVALAAMELCQMCVQGLWDKDSALLQLPNVARAALPRFRDAGVESVFDLMDLDEDAQTDLFSAYTPPQTKQIIEFVNAYPGLEVEFDAPTGQDEDDEVVANAPAPVVVTIRRDGDEDDDTLGQAPVVAPQFPGEKQENWWLVIGDVAKRALYGIKRVTVPRELRTRVDFVVPREGSHKLTMYLMCDSYLGCDQEFEFAVKVAPGEDESDDDEDEEDEDAMDVDARE
ncbi:Pre-mRNA-splicing helicase BRR2 [Blastocladiella emersonii ATCC 22665]|nr:Pre-mRNA-splicing helicase BRR2 [Blastocladiella emersonii ATCC 22665]